MPLYRFQCAACGHAFEDLVWTTSSTTTRVECPKCHSESVEKQLGTFAVRSAQGGSKASGADAPFCGRCGESRPPCGS